MTRAIADAASRVVGAAEAGCEAIQESMDCQAWLAMTKSGSWSVCGIRPGRRAGNDGIVAVDRVQWLSAAKLT
jgi:hypothetical protein